MSMELTYMAVDWKQLNQLDTESAFLEVLEEEEEWFFHLDEMDTSMNTNQFTATAWLDQRGTIPEDTWMAVTRLLDPVSTIDFWDEDESMPWGPMSWSPPDRERICKAFSPTDVEQWIKDYDSMDWAAVSKIVSSACANNSDHTFGCTVNDAFPYLKMWRDGFQEAADHPGYGVLILFLE